MKQKAQVMKCGDARYLKLEREGDGLTLEEMKAGWHFCLDWDEMLVGPEMTAEWDCCTCNYKNVREARAEMGRNDG